MIDDPLEWLSVALQDDEPTIPDPSAHGWWYATGHEEETRDMLADDDEDGDSPWD